MTREECFDAVCEQGGVPPVLLERNGECIIAFWVRYGEEPANGENLFLKSQTRDGRWLAALAWTRGPTWDVALERYRAGQP